MELYHGFIFVVIHTADTEAEGTRRRGGNFQLAQTTDL
jgi:hypothetical protein